MQKKCVNPVCIKVLLQQQKPQMEEALAKAQTEHLMRCALENQINLVELDDILQPIIDSCTKDSIANGNYITTIRWNLFILLEFLKHPIFMKNLSIYNYILLLWLWKLICIKIYLKNLPQTFLKFVQHSKKTKSLSWFFINYNFRKSIDFATSNQFS